MELEQIKDKLNKKEYDYFTRLSKYLELPLYFIGSVGRSDYIKGKSDFDIEVYTDNIQSTKLKVDYLFKNHKYENKYILFTIDKIPFSGYKYNLNEPNFRIDFVIFKKVCKKISLHHRIIENKIPIIMSILLIILKYLHYYFYLINNGNYSYIKKRIWYLYNPNKTNSIIIKDYETYQDYYNNVKIKTYLIDL